MKKFMELTFNEVYENNTKQGMLNLLGIDEVEWDMMNEKEQCEALGIPLGKWIKLEDYLYHNPITPGLSSSGMKAIYHKNPKYYRELKDNPVQKNKDALLIGRAVHKYILEPEDFEKEFFIYPDNVRKNSASYKKYQNDAQNKEMIKESVFENIKGMAKSLENYYNMLGVLRSGLREHAMFVWDEEYECVLRIKADSILKDKVLDLKTTQDASLDAFSKSVATFGYDLQAWLYLRICELGNEPKRMFGFVAVEKERPFLVNGIMIDPEDVSYYSSKVAQKVLEQYSYCLKTGNWFGYDFDWETKRPKPFHIVSLPNWFKYQVEEEVGFEG